MSVTISGLNLTALTFGLTEEIPISGSGDPSTNVQNLGNKIRGGTIVPVEYGSGTNQASVIAAALTAAVDGDTLIFAGSGVVKIETALSTSKNITIIGLRTIFRTTSNITILTMTGIDAICEGIFFEGNNTGAAQVGLAMSNSTGGGTVINCGFTNFNITGLSVAGSGTTPYKKSLISNCRFITCNGTGLAITSDYVTALNCDAAGCGKGYTVTGGNIDLIGCNANACTTPLELNSGVNTGKLLVSGGKFNHGTNGPVINSASNGVVLQGIQSVTSAMTVNADRVHFIGCELAASGSSNMNSKNLLFMGCIIATGGMTLTNKTNCVFVNNYDLSNVLWTG